MTLTSNSPHSYFGLMLSASVSGYRVCLDDIIKKPKKEVKHILGDFLWTGFMRKMINRALYFEQEVAAGAVLTGSRLCAKVFIYLLCHDKY